MSSLPVSPGEIWSTRVQKEVLVLTNLEEKNNRNIISCGLLPSFLKVKDYTLDIKKGVCKVCFLVVIEDILSNVKRFQCEKINRKDEDNIKANQSHMIQTGLSQDLNMVNITIILDASLRLYPHHKFDPSHSYPFLKPESFLEYGESFLPYGSTLHDSDPIEIDCDWTPSLHLNDAAQNIALKIRECMKRSEPFHSKHFLKATPNSLSHRFTTTISDSSARISNFFQSVLSVATEFGAELGETSEKSTFEFPEVNKLFDKKVLSSECSPKLQPSIETIKPGDLIQLRGKPWCLCSAIYSCKILKRPEFVMADLAMTNSSDKVASFSGAVSVINSFTKSAKSFVEKQFIMLTDELFLEIHCCKFSPETAKIKLLYPITQITKLKFQRHESVSLYFKMNQIDPLVYMCHDSGEVVKKIQSILKRHGLKGKHTNAIMKKSIQNALGNISDIKLKEKKLLTDPNATVGKINEIMELYRVAAEKFELAEDERHEDVILCMHEFLTQPFINSILDENDYSESESRFTTDLSNNIDDGNNTNVEYSTKHKTQDDETENKDENFRNTMKEAEDMLKDAQDDLNELGIGDNDFDVEESTKYEDGQAFSIFEDVLKDADKELEELMSS